MKRVRARDVKVDSYVTSYDVSSNPPVTEGESILSVKTNGHTLVEEWWHSSSGVQLRVDNEWSTGLKPTVFHKTFQVNSEDEDEDVGEGTGRDGEAQADEVEHRHPRLSFIMNH